MESLSSVTKGALLAAGGALLAALIDYASSGGLGPYGPLVGAAGSVLLNVLRKAAASAAGGGGK